MRTIRVKNRQELLKKYDGKIYAIMDVDGNHLFDVMEEEYIEMCDYSLIDPDTNHMKMRQGEDSLKRHRQKYAAEIFIADEISLADMVKKAAIAFFKDFCYKTGEIEDNNDDICLHRCKPKNACNTVWITTDHKEMAVVGWVGYDRNAEYRQYSGVMVSCKLFDLDRMKDRDFIFIAEDEALTAEVWQQITAMFL